MEYVCVVFADIPTYVCESFWPFYVCDCDACVLRHLLVRHLPVVAHCNVVGSMVRSHMAKNWHLYCHWAVDDKKRREVQMF